MAKKGILYIISAPSGAGKTSLVGALIKSLPNLQRSISHTTRAIRPSEQSGVDYHFISEPEFKEMRKKGVFLEYAEVFGNLYGTSSQWVTETLEKGIDVVLEIDWQGARQIRTHFVDSVSIFILPPSFETLRSRLQNRHQDNKEVIEQRLKEAKGEISHYTEYDYLICNDQFDDALEDVKSIIRCYRLSCRRQAKNLRDVITHFIS